MANPFPFTAGQVLTAAQMNGIGETVSFTPTWSGLTPGNGTVTFATYVRVQNMVFVQVQFVLGSTSAVTGNISFSAPTTAVTSPAQNQLGVVQFADASAAVGYMGTVSMSGSAIQLIPINASGTYATLTNASATVPFTWATGDVIVMSSTYRAA